MIYLPLVVILLLSTAFNGAIRGFITEAITWTVFAVTLVVLRRSIGTNGMDCTMRALLAPFVTPLLLQLASIALGVSIGSEATNLRSFIGGYLHESIFSRYVMMLLVIGIMIQWRGAFTKTFIIFYALFAVYMSAYRTTIIAVLPVAAVVLGVLTLSVCHRRYRPALFLMLAVSGVLGFAAVLPHLPERYAQVTVALGQITDLVQEPKAFTHDQRNLFSGRFFIWSFYISHYLEGNPAQRLLGLGPYSDAGRYYVDHAHNSYVQYLYEYGLFGFFALVFVFLYNLHQCVGCRDETMKITLFSIHLAFIILNLSTGVLKSIEGLQLYSIIMAVTLAMADPIARSAASPPRRRPPRNLLPSADVDPRSGSINPLL